MRRGFLTPGGFVGKRGDFGADNSIELLQIYQRSIALVEKLEKRSIEHLEYWQNDRCCRGGFANIFKRSK
jgi:hypothetical protein